MQTNVHLVNTWVKSQTVCKHCFKTPNDRTHCLTQTKCAPYFNVSSLCAGIYFLFNFFNKLFCAGLKHDCQQPYYIETLN